MDELQSNISKIKSVIDQDKDLEDIADELLKIQFSFDVEKASDDVGLKYNYAVLSHQFNGLRFAWDDFIEEDQEKFLREELTSIKRLLKDIDIHNVYSATFHVNTNYHKMNDEWKWKNKEIWQDLEAKTISEAKQQRDKIKANTPRHSPNNPELVLEEVNLIMKVRDSKGEECALFAIK